MGRTPWIVLGLLMAAFWNEASGVPAGTTGALRLQVAQSQGAAPIEGATIVVIDPQLSVFRREAKTDASGRAEILDLAPRDYYLRVEKETFQSHESSFTARPGEMTQRRVELARFGPGPPPGEEPSPGRKRR